MGAWGAKFLAALKRLSEAGVSPGKFYATVLNIAEGRFSLQVVIAASIILFWIAFLLVVFTLLFGLYQRLRASYRANRRLLYEPAIEKVLMEEPLEAVIRALTPRRRGDESVIQEVMIDAMRHLTGPPFDLLRTAAFRLGFVERNLRMLHARSRFRRGTALEALGVMRASQAVVAILAVMKREHLDLKLVGLRALAAIGNPATLPYFFKIADELPRPMMVRLASLMMEFGPPSRPWIQNIINHHPKSFPPQVMEELRLKLAALGTEGLR